METIKSVANTASGYIYGQNENKPTQSGTEPIAGETGKGTASEPYDKGNAEPSAAEPSTYPEDAEAETPKASEQGVHDESKNLTNPSLEDLYITGNKRYRGGRQVSYFTPASAAPKPIESTPSDRPAGLGPTDPADGADPASGQKPFQKQEGADRPMEVPTGKEEDAVKETKDEGEELIKKRDPNDHSGEPMHMHDGSEESVDKKEEDGEHPGQEGGGRHGEDGTGEKWIKTSGLKADGGDFDAAQAGAGREADRLLEEKGIQRDDRGGMVTKEGEAVSSDHKSPSPGGHSKVKTIDKIKEKLHIGTSKSL